MSTTPSKPLSSSRTAPSGRSRLPASARGRKNAFTWEINGSKGSIAFDLERLNELQVNLKASKPGERAQGFRDVLVSEADHPFWEHWWPHGHIIGWEHSFVHEIHHFLKVIAEDGGCTAPRRDLRGRLQSGRGLRLHHPVERVRPTGRRCVSLTVAFSSSPPVWVISSSRGHHRRRVAARTRGLRSRLSPEAGLLRTAGLQCWSSLGCAPRCPHIC